MAMATARVILVVRRAAPGIQGRVQVQEDFLMGTQVALAMAAADVGVIEE